MSPTTYRERLHTDHERAMLDYVTSALKGEAPKPPKREPVETELRQHLRQKVTGTATAPAPVEEGPEQDAKAVAFAMLEPETRQAVVRREPWAEHEYRQALNYVEQERLQPTGWRIGDPE